MAQVRILYACGGGEQKTSQSGTRNNNGSSPGWSTRMSAPRPGTSWFNTAKSTLCLSSNTKSRPTLTYAEARKPYVRQTHVDRARTFVGSRYTKTNDIHIRLRCVPLDRMRLDSRHHIFSCTTSPHKYGDETIIQCKTRNFAAFVRYPCHICAFPARPERHRQSIEGRQTKRRNIYDTTNTRTSSRYDNLTLT